MRPFPISSSRFQVPQDISTMSKLMGVTCTISALVLLIIGSGILFGTMHGSIPAALLVGVYVPGGLTLTAGLILLAIGLCARVRPPIKHLDDMERDD